MKWVIDIIPVIVYVEQIDAKGIVRMSSESWTTGYRPIPNDRTKEVVICNIKGNYRRVTMQQLIQSLYEVTYWNEQEAISEAEYKSYIDTNSVVDNEDFWQQYDNLVKLRHKLKIAESNVPPKCPKCGTTMEIKMGKRGEFWSCLGYPTCSGSLDYEWKIDRADVREINRDIRIVEKILSHI